ncbi:MAG: primosomal protein N' [Candidatus Saccharimonadales bacterium]
MFYYFVWVRSHKYHGSEPLTYSHDRQLATGSIVRVEMRGEIVMGIISGPTTQPRFKTKPLTAALDLPALPLHLLKTAQWLLAYYPAPLGIVSQQLVPGNFSERQLALPAPAEYPDPDLSKLPPLTTDQSRALEEMQRTNTYLLHGQTGSGKTRLYIELAQAALARGRSSIILTPEISLTAQLTASFTAVFGQRVITIHSGQAPAERQKAWLDALRATQPVIIIGPRSALFTPVRSLGLIVLDEAHEAAYKQEQAPQYHAGRVASYLAPLSHASLVLGTATPSVSDYFLASERSKPIIRLDHPAIAVAETDRRVQLVDMRDRDNFDRSRLLSTALIKAIELALSRGEQTLLYLNRRGTARIVLCESCGWQATCPHCDLPLTYHGDRHELRCHSCDYHSHTPTSCRDCGHTEIIYKTAGTKAIVDEVTRLFPGASVARFDTDNAKADRFEQHYTAVKNGEVDILVGTQLLAKGLDLPKLAVLGVVLADTSLSLPDFTSPERTYQLLTQVLGRISRGHRAGLAIIQTYNPDHPVLADAVADNYAAFYARELAERQQFLFPPFCHLLKLSCRRASTKAAESAAQKLADSLRGNYRVRVEGPAPSFYEKLQGKYQWQLIVKATERSELLRVIAHLPANWSYDIDPADLL